MVREPVVRLRYATAADHLALEDLFSAVGPPPAREALAVSLDHPEYQPSQRLLVECDGSPAAHVQLVPRTMQVGGTQIPVRVLCQVMARPEPSGQTYDAALVRAAGRVMVERKIPVALLATRDASRYEAFGWTAYPRPWAAAASTRSLLSRLAMRGLRAENSPMNIRPWRQIELPALVHLHAQGTAGRAGGLVRSEQDWRWLIASGLFDRIYVALAAEPDADGPGEGRDSPVAAYAVVRDDRILELMESPTLRQSASGMASPLDRIGALQRGTAAEHLLVRIASEAIERDSHWLRLHAPQTSSLRELFPEQAASAAPGGRQLLARVNDPALLLRHLESEMLARAARAGLGLPCEIGLDASPLKLLVRLSRRGLQMRPGKLGRSYLRCDQKTLSSLLLGMADAEQAVHAGKLQPSTRLALETAQALFPASDFWCSPWDHVDCCC